MRNAASLTEPENAGQSPPWPEAARSVLRAVGEARRGVAVLIGGGAVDAEPGRGSAQRENAGAATSGAGVRTSGGAGPGNGFAGGDAVWGGAWLALATETASPDSLAECLALRLEGTSPLLLLASSRAVWGRLGAAGLPGAGNVAVVRPGIESLTVEALRALADPTAGPSVLLASGGLDAAAIVAGTPAAGVAGTGVAGAAAPGGGARGAEMGAPAEPGGDAYSAPEPGVPPAVARAALTLAKLARLLPAVLVVRASPACAAAVRDGRLLRVAASDISAYPAAASEGLVMAASARVPLDAAEESRLVAFRPPDGGIEHLALLVGAPEAAEAPLVRLHSECFTGDLLGSRRCDCGPQLHQAIQRMAAEGAGVLLYLAQEGRGIGLVNKLRAYRLQDAGLDTLDANQALGFDADERRFGVAARMLALLGLRRIRLLTNNPDKIEGLRAHGIEVVGRVSHAIAANGENDKYLETKARRFGHLLG